MVIVKPLGAARIRCIFEGDGGAVAFAQRDLQRQGDRPVALLLVTAGGEVNTAAAPQVTAPGEVQQLGFLIVETLHTDPRRANVAKVAKVKGQGILIRIAAQAGNGLVVFIIDGGLIVEREVAEAAIATAVLGGDTEGVGTVLVTPVELSAGIAAHFTLGPGAVHYPETAQFDDGPGPAQRQLLRPFDVPFQRQPVGEAITIRAAARRRAVVKILDTVIAAQAAEGHGPVA